jgi:hypothetical protein
MMHSAILYKISPLYYIVEQEHVYLILLPLGLSMTELYKHECCNHGCLSHTFLVADTNKIKHLRMACRKCQPREEKNCKVT